MCRYVSVVITEKGEIRAGVSLDSHEGIAAGWKLKPGSYREVEWTRDSSDYLTVRVEDGEKPAYYKRLILRQFKTRRAMLAAITEGRGELGSKAYYRNGKLHRCNGPAIEYPTGTKCWYHNGKLHRDDGPAIEYSNGEREWYLNGKRQLDGSIK